MNVIQVFKEMNTSAMASSSFRNSLGWKLDSSSYSIQMMIIDVMNLLYISIFYLVLLVGYFRKHNTVVSGNIERKDWVFVCVAFCCGFTSIVCFGNGLWKLISEEESGFDDMNNWLVYLVRGFVWLSFAISLLVKKSKWVKVFVSVWWVSFSFFSSALNIEFFLRTQSIQIYNILTSPLNLLLLFSAFRNYSSFGFQRIDESDPLSDPLLVEKAEKKETQLGQAGFLSKLTFSWVNPLLELGYSKPLSLEDIPLLVSEDEADVAYRKFKEALDSITITRNRKKSLKSRSNNFVLKAIIKVWFKENISIAVCTFLKTLSVVSLPLLLYAFVNYANRDEENIREGLFLLMLLVVCKVVDSLSQRHSFFNSRRSGMRIRSGLMAAVYRKQLKLSSLGRRNHSIGEIVNYIAVDAYRMGDFLWWFHWSCGLTLQLFLSILVLFWVVGVAALPGLVPLVICTVCNVPFVKLLQTCQTEFMIAQDERLRATSEILNNMKIIKLQSWEEEFKKMIESRRDVEFKWLSKSQLVKAYGTLIYWMAPTIISSVIFFGCALFGSSPLNASTIFTVLATLRGMAEPVRVIPEALSVMIQVKVSLDRINRFLLDHEIKNDEVTERKPDVSVKIEAGNFSWDPEQGIPTLRDIELEIKPGQKFAVCGQVGAGKSSLLYSILQEIPKVSGNVDVFGSIAYVSQTSWIQSGTIRDNILYGKEMDCERYDKAIKSCALDKDINNFNHGDLTEIGQRGLNLSGGQKQRIQLARAVYNDADIYLFDDPFSAVDAQTAAILFKECVMEALEKKTVILVTHQVEFLSEVDKILVMEGGEITQSGGYTDLLMEGTPFEQLVNSHKEAINILASTDSKNKVLQIEDDSLREEKREEEEISTKGLQGGIQLTQEEEKERGDVGFKPFLDYISISNGRNLACLGILFQCGFVALQTASTCWLAFAIQFPKISSVVLIGTYTAISTLSAVFVYLKSYVFAHLGLKASRSFFLGFTDSIFKAPMLFFDSVPVGRILTRASSDLSILDFDIPFALWVVLASAIELLAIVGIIASVTWQVLIVAVLAFATSKYMEEYYLVSAREIIRINGTTKAPVMNYASETSLGVVTIRAYKMTNMFFRNFLRLIDTDARLFFHSHATIEWLVLRIEMMQNVTLFTATLLLILLPKGYVAPGLIGLSLSYAFSLTLTQVYLTKWFCNLSNYIISVERIKQFMHIPPEPPAIVEDHRPPASWPLKGNIQLQDLKIRYRPNAPLVLKGITCRFKEGSRVGVVGRTGSGKTTLISALFRLVEPASGRILIDGLDICKIGLKDLRMKLSIIPQEPTLFKGSVRTNLDPLGLFSDEEIWKALDKCQLQATISSLPNKLDSSVSDEGENWSAGQRQLFCLGRVLLRRNRILVLDEATASIDSATDAILQKIIRNEFSECTVITVAHRVPTVIDSDMVMVLSFGKLLEYDEPSKLMEITNSSFSKLVAEYWSSCRRNSLSSF